MTTFEWMMIYLFLLVLMVGVAFAAFGVLALMVQHLGPEAIMQALAL